jgi:putative nucleotidyltransferase with HDIG domain
MQADPLHVLLVEDNPGDARLIREMLAEVSQNGFQFEHKATLHEGIAKALEFRFDVILLDLSLPDSQGMDTVRGMFQAVPEIPIIVLTGYADESTALTAVKTGAQDYLVKGRGDGETIRRAIRYAIERSHLEDERRGHDERLRRALMQTIQAMGLTIEKRDPYTAGHQERVARLAAAIGREMGFDDDRIQGIELGSLIHDIGKVGLPASFLNKPGRLTTIEFALIKSHSQVGYEIVKDVEFAWPIAKMVLQHHERMNGTGYPNGLSGDSILMEARIISVADVIESMASHRPYRPALGLDAAMAEIAANSGSLYDPDVVKACLALFGNNRFSFEEMRLAPRQSLKA